VGLFSAIKRNRTVQYLISFGLISLIAIVAHFSVDLTGYKVVALILLLAVSILAMIFDIWPVVLTAIYSALIWNFFFIPPLFNFTIDTPEDALLFLMYFVIAMLNAVLTSKIRKAEIKAKEEEERKNTIILYNTVLNSLSHELKTPISTIIGAIDTLKETPSKLSEQHRIELLSEIDSASMRLNRQVENLLNMSRLESGFIKPQLDWCDMSELVHKVIQNIQLENSGHLIKFVQKEEIPLFKLDRGLIEQVIYNIAHNSIQYTPPQSIISIGVAHQNESCIITISDNGPGFPEKELASVFKKFYRLPNSATGGTGLGLSIVKGFIEAHHGEVFLENQREGGAKFILVIPAETSYLKDIQYD
jgi:two-component system sensor histidine kinase KdpD